MTTVSDETKGTAKNYLEKLFKVLEYILEQADNENNPGDCCDLKDVEKKLTLLKSDFTNPSCAILYEVALKLEYYQDRVNQSFSEEFELSDMNKEKFNEYQELKRKRREASGK